MILPPKTRTLALGALFVLASASAYGTSVEFGNPANDNNRFPFNGSATVGTRYQQIYNQGHFSGPVTIDSITFFSHELGNFREGDYILSLSTSSRDVTGLGSMNTDDFDSNLGADNTIFLALHLSGAIGATHTFDGVDFAYDPALGNLLLDIQVANANDDDQALAGSGSMQARNGDFGDDSSRAHNFGSEFESWGLRTRFNLAGGAAVPETGSSLALFGLSLIAILRAHRRKVTK